MEDPKKQYADIAVQYNLPENWGNETTFSFDHLSEMVTQLHNSAYTASVKAINRFATVRNYVIGFYIVEYEQHGNDRAKYGDKLLKRLAERVNKRGINETLLKVSRAFYLNYPHVKSYLEGKSAMPSHQSALVSSMASSESSERGAMRPSHPRSPLPSSSTSSRRHSPPRDKKNQTTGPHGSVVFFVCFAHGSILHTTSRRGCQR